MTITITFWGFLAACLSWWSFGCLVVAVCARRDQRDFPRDSVDVGLMLMVGPGWPIYAAIKLLRHIENAKRPPGPRL